jgi:hypothetical protein
MTRRAQRTQFAKAKLFIIAFVRLDVIGDGRWRDAASLQTTARNAAGDGVAIPIRSYKTIGALPDDAASGQQLPTVIM